MIFHAKRSRVEFWYRVLEHVLSVTALEEGWHDWRWDADGTKAFLAIRKGQPIEQVSRVVALLA